MGGLRCGGPFRPIEQAEKLPRRGDAARSPQRHVGVAAPGANFKATPLAIAQPLPACEQTGLDSARSYEDVRDHVRALVNTEAFRQSSRERKKVEMRFAHMKRILKLDRLRLRGLSGAKDEVLLTATAQNLRRLAKLVCHAPPATVGCLA